MLVRVLFAGGGTGGHLYPGIAIARALLRLQPSVQPFFVGARRGVEREILPTTGFPHALLDLHPLYRSRPWRNWHTLVGLASAWRGLADITRSERPRLVVATGGYAAGAALAFAARHGIATVLQEQNAFPGLTQKLFAPRAREVYLGFPEARRRFPLAAATRFVDTGNPIEPPPTPLPSRAVGRAAWGFPATGGIVVLVVGGSQGAGALNEVVAEWVRAGIDDGTHLIWATGAGSFDRYAKLEGERVRVRRYLSPIAEAYAVCDVAVARAGAMTTAELCAWGIPSILVPLPTAAADHQTANAVALAADGAAIHIPQRELSADLLRSHVASLAAHAEMRESLSAYARARGRPHAAETIAHRILSVLDVDHSHS
ncbi:MAG: undecaprenyldiphospho-muramoylpentapeptide beta-N-acetylglucosaminyltransferase [Gemmatimonadaceae bacterium]